jgi:two-component system, OmpR family, osmolarity sensor histidine kinase EnvZ
VTLFARAFLLIAALIVAALLASFQIYSVYEREPRSRELAQQTVSTVNLTRAALVNADPERRRQLLIELNETEGLRVYPVTASEKTEPLPDDPLLERVVQKVRQALGGDTRFSYARDGEEGFLVSFFIDEDEFWVMLPRERFELGLGLQWLGWLAAVVVLALAGAWFIASNIARPLAAMRRAALRLGRGQPHEPLPEKGPRELRTVAAAFNRMAANLEGMERDRAMVLAGISHDLRTPLSRLRLALEMSGADAQASDAMIADIDEMDAIIGQFLDFARGADEQKEEHDLGEVLGELAEHYARIGKDVRLIDHPVKPFRFARMAVRRAVANLIDNALRYAGEPVELELLARNPEVAIEVRDLGPGVPANEVERLKRPFTRLDDSRAGHGGSGLGLAIVERTAQAHGG